MPTTNCYSLIGSIDGPNQDTISKFSALFSSLNSELDVLDVPCIVTISSYSFCVQGFEPNWDYKILACQHVYHSWCTTTHFAFSLKCLHKGCDRTPHLDWWRLNGLKLPTTIEGHIDEDVGLLGQQVGMFIIFHHLFLSFLFVHFFELLGCMFVNNFFQSSTFYGGIH